MIDQQRQLWYLAINRTFIWYMHITERTLWKINQFQVRKTNVFLLPSFFSFFLSSFLPSFLYPFIQQQYSGSHAGQSLCLTQLMQRCMRMTSYPEDVLHVAMLRSHKNTRPTGKGKCDYKRQNNPV